MSKKKKSEKRGRGQPALPESEKRTPQMYRTNQAERKLIAKRAKKAGVTVATYVRMRATGEL